MPYFIKGKCIYKKDTGKKVGCTKGDVKKYMAALHSHVKESMNKYQKICSILNETDMSVAAPATQQATSIPSAASQETNLHAPATTPEEKAKRRRMLKRMAALGMLAGAGVTAAELMLHKGSRRDLKQAMQLPGLKQKLFAASKGVEGTAGYHPGGIARQVWKPMAIGVGADLAIEPTNMKIAQHMEDRLQKREKNRDKQN